MRIISGRYKGRKIQPPVNLPVRPTTDYAREGLFNVLHNFLDLGSVRVLDLFAGTGSISLEFCSRGSPEVLAVDIERRCIEFINRIAGKLEIASLKAVRVNVFVFLKHVYRQFDLVFADPPYNLEGLDLLPDTIMKSGILVSGGWLILEHPGRFDFTRHPAFVQSREYGSVHFTFFRQGER